MIPCVGPNEIITNTALWEEAAEREFYVYKGLSRSGSSLFRQNVGFVRANFESLRARGPRVLADSWFERSELVRTENIVCQRLDDVLDELALPFSYHVLKSDSQGGELQGLRGPNDFSATTASLYTSNCSKKSDIKTLRFCQRLSSIWNR